MPHPPPCLGVQLVTPERASVARYAPLLVQALRDAGEDATLVTVPQPELRIGKRRFGGLIAPWLQPMPGGHALDPTVVGRKTRLVTVHDLAEEIFPEHYGGTLAQRLNVRASRWVARRVPFLMAPSAVTKRDLVERWGVEPERIAVAPWGIDHAVFRPQPDVEREPRLLVTWSDDQPRKNLVLIVRAMKRLRDEGHDVRFERAGGRWEGAAWRAYAKAEGLDVVERGFLPRAELPRLAARGVFVWPSFHEGFGWPPLEAMACGAPVVALDNAINREILGDAALYHRDDPADAARAIREALTSPPPVARLVEQAARYTWARCAEAHVRAYRAAGLT